MNEINRIEVLYVEPMKEPRVVEIDGSLKSMQELVGGYIEELCRMKMNLRKRTRDLKKFITYKIRQLTFVG